MEGFAVVVMRLLNQNFPLLCGCIAMAMVVCLSNILVQYPIVGATLFGVVLADWLTWGAFSFPVVFLINDQTNRRMGLASARKVVLAGFIVGVVLSIWLATPRIAIASGVAFLVGQLLDASIFDRFREGQWWRAPLFSSVPASVVDTTLFFSIAFVGTAVPWQGLAAGDLTVKLLMVAILLPVYRLMVPRVAR